MTHPLPPEREGSTRRRRAGEGLSSGNAATDNAYDALPTQRSRELRNNATPAERKLWSVLGNRQLSGVRFNRQVVIRPYICDLVARSAKLVIEIDGGHEPVGGASAVEASSGSEGTIAQAVEHGPAAAEVERLRDMRMVTDHRVRP